MRLKTEIERKEATFQVVLDALTLTPFYHAFLITADVPAIYMQEFWATISVHKSSIRFMINKKKVSLDVDMFCEILQFCPKILGQKFEDLPLEQDIISFVRDLGHTGDINYLTNELTNQAMLESNAYKTYYAFASGEKPPKLKYIQKKADPNTSPKQKPVQAIKGTRLKYKAKVSKSDKKKQPAKKPKAKGLAVLSEVTLTKAKQLKLATKRSKKEFHISHESGSGDGVNTQLKVHDEQQQNTSGTDEGTGIIPGVPDVPTYESKSEKESWGDNDKQEGDDMNDDDEETDSDRNESDRIKIPMLDQSTIEFYEE
ncbi:hypothetical protein Tco_0185375 [Tanacetum coccineum]